MRAAFAFVSISVAACGAPSASDVFLADAMSLHGDERGTVLRFEAGKTYWLALKRNAGLPAITLSMELPDLP